MDDQLDLGATIKHLRGNTLTQKELAERANVSIDLIRKLEQGRRHTASVLSLQAIARALDVDLARLVRKSTPLPSADPQSGVVALRRVLTSVDALLGAVTDDGEAVSLDEVGKDATFAWGAYWAGRYDDLGVLLPQALIRARAVEAHASTAERAGAADVLTQIYQIASCTLVHLGEPDAAWLAVQQAVSAAARGDDPLRVAALRGTVAWLLLTQGRYAEARNVAVHGASSIEPTGNVPFPHLSVYGSLTLAAATAAGRARSDSDAADLLAVAGDTAARIGADRNDYETAFGTSQVVMQTADVQVVSERFSDALRTAGRMPRDAALPLAARNRHLADVAYAQMKVGHHSKSIDTLLAMEAAGRDWMKHQTLPRQTIAELLDGTQPARLRDLARRVKAGPRT